MGTTKVNVDGATSPKVVQERALPNQDMGSAPSTSRCYHRRDVPGIAWLGRQTPPKVERDSSVVAVLVMVLQTWAACDPFAPHFLQAFGLRMTKTWKKRRRRSTWNWAHIVTISRYLQSSPPFSLVNNDDIHPVRVPKVMGRLCQICWFDLSKGNVRQAYDTL